MNMSFALTRPQVEAGTKTVTRRLGWRNIKPGARVTPVEKCQGLRKGEKVQRVGTRTLVVTHVRREPLAALLQDRSYGSAEVAREGFPDKSAGWFVEMFCRANGCADDVEVTRIEFTYED